MARTIEIEVSNYEYKALYSHAGIRGFDSVERYIMDAIEADKNMLYRFSRVDVGKNLITYLCERNLEASINTLESFKRLIDELEKAGLDGRADNVNAGVKRNLETLGQVKENFNYYMDGLEYDWNKELEAFKDWYNRNVK
jgi:hypothetical protein